MNSRSVLFFLLVFTLPALKGCDSPEDSALTVFELVETERLGSRDGEDAFGNPLDLVANGDDLYILEGLPPSIVHIGQDRSVRTVFSREGEGPGELTRPRSIGLTDGSLWVADVGARELEVFLEGGAPLDALQIHVPPDPNGSLASPQSFLPEGLIIAGPTGAVGGTIDHENYYLVDRIGTVLDTLYSSPFPETDLSRPEHPWGGTGLGSHPLPERPLVAFFPDGSGMVAVERWQANTADTASYRVRVWGRNGDVETDFPVRYKPILAEGWEDLELDRLRARPDAASMPPADLEGVLKAFEESWSSRRFIPPVTDVSAGSGGVIFVRREEAAEGNQEWDLLSRDGEPIGVLLAPPGMSVLEGTCETVWGLVRDELDVPFIVRFEIRELTVTEPG